MGYKSAAESLPASVLGCVCDFTVGSQSKHQQLDRRDCLLQGRVYSRHCWWSGRNILRCCKFLSPILKLHFFYFLPILSCASHSFAFRYSYYEVFWLHKFQNICVKCEKNLLSSFVWDCQRQGGEMDGERQQGKSGAQSVLTERSNCSSLFGFHPAWDSWSQ